MSIWIWVALAVVLVGLYLSWTAGRLDRLHARIDAAKAGLDAQLLRRSSATLELSTSTLLDPAASVLLYQAAHAARTASEEGRELAESELSQALRAVFAEPEQVKELHGLVGGEEYVVELSSAVRRVPMARTFHNDSVRAARAVRRHRIVRLFRLAGYAPFPQTVEIDDEAPPVLVAPA